MGKNHPHLWDAASHLQQKFFLKVLAGYSSYTEITHRARQPARFHWILQKAIVIILSQNTPATGKKQDQTGLLSMWQVLPHAVLTTTLHEEHLSSSPFSN